VKGRIPAALAAISFFAATGSAQAQFTQEGLPYPTGNAPYNTYAADFNGDGRPDLVTSNGDAQSVSVFLRQAGGGFAAEAGSPFTLPGATSNGTIGDFNGDGRPDLAITDIQGTGVVIALRNPVGGFTQEANVPLGGQLGAVGAGDFNQDGKLDIAVANYGSANVSVLLRNPANNGFALAPNGNYAVGAQPRQIAIADFNGDLRPDIAVTNVASGTVSVLLNSGNAIFSTEAPITVGLQPNGITARDFDGDGRPDLAVANTGDDTVSILSRSPLGGFTPAAGSPVAVGDGPVNVGSGDFDGNGTLDIAVADTSGSLDVIQRGVAGFARTSTTAVAAGATGLAVTDVNLDSRPDVAVSSIGANLLTVFLSPSPPPPPPPVATPAPTATATPLAPPVINKTVNATPVRGKVRVKLPKTSKFIDLAEAKQLPNGTEIDTRKGRVTITASASRGKTEKADFYDGLFKVTQARRLTTLTLSEKLTGCKKSGAKASAAAKKPKTRKLWGSGKGKFRTRGQYGAATIRGTQWLVQDKCTSTAFKVKQGSVNVRDDVKKKTVIVRKGRTYTARAKKR
jgi:FG-GAP-like repeat/FG-GAP repeat